MHGRNVLKQSLSYFSKQIFIKTSEIRYEPNPSQKSINRWSEGKDVWDFNKLNIFRFPYRFWNKDWATFANIIASRQVKSSINKILHQVQKILVRGNHKPDCNKLSGFRFSEMCTCWNKVWATLVNRIALRQVKLSNHEILHQSPENAGPRQI